MSLHACPKSLHLIILGINPAELLDEGRVYGGGLYKMEPNELANVKADGIRELLSADVPVQHMLFEAVA